jgi:hypothetical protein
MARPMRPTRTRSRILPGQVEPSGQPPVPTVPGASPGATTTTTTIPPDTPATVGPTAPTPEAAQPVDVQQSTTTRSAESLILMTQLGEELANQLVQLDIAANTVYLSEPLGFEGLAQPIRLPETITTTDPETGEQITRPASQLVNGQTQQLVQTVYTLNPSYLPEDPWARYARQIPQIVVAQTDPENYMEVNQRAQALFRSLGPRRDDPTQFRLATPETVNQTLLSMPLEDYNVVRQALVNTGLLKQQDYGDPASRGISAEVRRAAIDAATLANTDGMDWVQYLVFKANSGAALGNELPTTPGAGAVMPTIRVTAADDLKFVLNRTAQSYLGRGLSDEEMTPMVDEIQKREAEAQRAAMYGGTVEAAPSASAIAAEQVQEQFGQEYDVYQMGNYLDVFRQMLGGQR